jgi:hypothetical protein
MMQPRLICTGPYALTITLSSFVEFETAADLRAAVEKLDGREFKNCRVTCVANVMLRTRRFSSV